MQYSDIKEENILDVAIIGGGVSGLYTGYRLIDNHQKTSLKKITLFEMSHRLGGRIWSVKIPGSDHLVADIGAIRFLTAQKNIYGLVKDELCLPTISFSSDHNIEYFRNHHYLYSDYENTVNFPNKIPYFLRKDEMGLNPSQLMAKVYQQMVPELDHIKDTRQIRQILQKKIDVMGQPLSAWNSLSLLRQYLSNEATHLLYDSIGFKPDFDQINAYEFFDDIGALTGTKYLTVRDGLQTIPQELAKHFEQKGGDIALDQKLYTFSIINHQGNNLIRLELGSPALHHPNKIVYAKHLVLAMPQHAIQLLQPFPTIFMDLDFLENLNSVVPRQLGRVFLSYDTPWWQKIPMISFKSGKSNTDLPMQQCYYLGSEQAKSGNKNSLLFATSHNGNDFLYWKNYFPNGMENVDPEYIAHYKTELPELLLNDLFVQLTELHGVTVPLAKYAVYMEWSQNPFGGAYHGWKPQVKPWEIIPYMRQPFKDDAVYIVGEAFSSNHAWIEGALNSAEKLLEQQFGLPRARWIPENYDLGD